MNETRYLQSQIENAIIASQNALDQGDVVTFSNYFAEEGRLVRPAASDPICGRDAIMAAYQNNPPERLNRHVISNVQVNRVDEHEANSISYVTLYSATQTDQPKPVFGWPVERILLGEYHDRWRYRSGQWLLLERRAFFSINLQSGDPS